MFNWFGSKDTLKAKTVSRWIGSVKSGRDKQGFHKMRKAIQSEMFNQIAATFLPIKSEGDGEVVYLAVHFLSGRAFLPKFRIAAEVNPEAAREAERLFNEIIAQPAPTEDFEMATLFNCSLEITNETIEGHYNDALALANHGVTHWPSCGELRRQRGVLRLTQEDYRGALEDLRAARYLRPDMLWLAEPTAFAERKLSSQAPQRKTLQ